MTTTLQLQGRTARFAILTVVCTATLFAGLGRAALWEPDEARYAEGTRQMLERGDFLTPWFNGEPRLEKPVLFYWMQMPFFAVLGPSEAAARAPVALLGAGSVLMTYLIGARLFGPQVAWMAALVFATSFRPITFARLGHTDMPALFFELVALHAFLRSAQDSSARRAWIIAWTAVGLATLTKGPVAAIPVAVWAAYLAVTRDRTGFRHMRLVPGALLAAAIAAPWYGYMVITHGRAFVDVALMSEVVARVGGDVGPRRGPFYYFTVWPGDMLPWTPFFVAALSLLAVFRTRFDPTVLRGAILPVVWFVVVVAVFSLSSSKLPHYLLPAYPAAALLTALFIDRAERDAAARRMWWAATVLVVLVLAVAGILGGALLRRATVPVMSTWLVLPLLLVLGGVCVVALGRRRGPLVGSTAIAMTVAAAVGYAAVVAAPRLEGMEPVRRLSLMARAASAPGVRIGQYGISSGLVFYTHQRVQSLKTHDEVARFLHDPGLALCVLSRADAATIARLAPGQVFELAHEQRLVVRLDRLFGDRSPYEEPLVLVSNHPRSD